MSMIVNIDIDRVKNHPQNVRKNYSGIEELAESIKAQGILQNLTVVPLPGDPGTYYAVIGNRRLKAAKLAGLKTVPCYIADWDEKKQVSTMLSENMGRSDLSVSEQAYGFQMMFDLGETEKDIAKQSGFSRTTVRHRLEIAKLDRELLQQRENEDGFQLSITDLYELEKIKDADERNKILKNATNSKELRWRVQSAVEKRQQDERTKEIAEILSEKGIMEMSKEDAGEVYSDKWIWAAAISLEEDFETIDLDIDEDEEAYWLRRYNEIVIYSKDEGQGQELTEEILEEKKRGENKKRLMEIIKRISGERENFIRKVAKEKTDPLGGEERKDGIWRIILESENGVSINGIINFLYGKDRWQMKSEELEEVKAEVFGLSIERQLDIALHGVMKTLENNLVRYDGSYNAEAGRLLEDANGILNADGYSLSDLEEVQVVDGTSELYESEDKNVDSKQG